jgi:outer membrane lipopolysaccharide assembly protein LptE/RlpB
MQKITILLTALILSLSITSCGFHAPYKSNSVNLEVKGDKDFARIINRKLNKSLESDLVLKIKNITKNNTNEDFKSNNVSGYNVEIIVDFVVNNGNSIIVEDRISASRYLKYYNTGSNSHQEKKIYKDMQGEIADKIIRRVSKLSRL